MAKHFTAGSNARNGYAAMGNSKRRPHYPSVGGGSVADSIARARRTAARQAQIKKK